ncbi:hypothetical protein [Streptomyces olivaceiscleroticus]|uniref:Uncharacterized protein n=1 Tax=Streptomyces olivaceiscleroticus TaxID=68245 RepID=A0ABN1BMP8_9ACTN
MSTIATDANATTDQLHQSADQDYATAQAQRDLQDHRDDAHTCDSTTH